MAQSKKSENSEDLNTWKAEAERANAACVERDKDAMELADKLEKAQTYAEALESRIRRHEKSLEDGADHIAKLEDKLSRAEYLSKIKEDTIQALRDRVLKAEGRAEGLGAALVKLGKGLSK